MTDFEKFINDKGYKYTTEDELRAGYDRLWKCNHGVMLTESEFLEEIKPDMGEFTQEKREAGKESYAALVELVEAGKLKASDIYSYAMFRWCLNGSTPIIAYQTERDKWEVNNCDTEITTERAIVEINREWGFEASRVKIIGTPYYDATDWMFIRFNCARMEWLWTNGNLYKVYE